MLKSLFADGLVLGIKSLPTGDQVSDLYRDGKQVMSCPIAIGMKLVTCGFMFFVSSQRKNGVSIDFFSVNEAGASWWTECLFKGMDAAEMLGHADELLNGIKNSS